MTSVMPAAEGAAERPRRARLAALHGRLMPDYNGKAAAYWWAVVLLGALVLTHAVHAVAGLPPRAWGMVAGGAVLAMLAGLVPVRVPRSPNSYTAGEIFIFRLLLAHGPEAAAVASAGEALVGSIRTSRRWTSRIASPAMAAVAMYVAGGTVDAGLRDMARHGWASDALLLVSAIAFALLYFVLNTVMVTMIGRLKHNAPLRLRAFLDAFAWLGVAYAGNASVATFLFLSFRQSGIVVVVAAVPIIAILLMTGHFYFKREEAADAMRKARAERAKQREMMENARQAGMAEIATNVLHNVGNVLNSINVSVDLIAERVRRSESPGLARAVKLLDAHANDLGQYLSSDPRGRLLPDYLRQLAGALVEEQRGMADELRVLTNRVKHIQQIVATQQAYAGARGVTEAVCIFDLIEDALRINSAGAAGRDAQVTRRYREVPSLLLDKHRVLLILVNLISNAKNATSGLPAMERRIEVRVELRPEGLLAVVVEDNGEGIAAGNLTRIFAHGFTTRKHGHGFGLHSCALAAREMGGTLAVHSDGPGKGARFTLQLPATQEPERG
jgi:signal transduction histidine kinase